MTTYKFLHIGWQTSAQGSYLTVYSPDEGVAQWLISEVEKHLGSRIERYPFSKGEDQRFQMKGLKNRDREVQDWLIKRLCETGWEPFAVWPNVESNHTRPQYCFRWAIQREGRNS